MPEAFQGVLVSDKPTSIAAIPVFNKFLVHCESALFSYPLDLVIRVSREDATSKDLTDLEEKLAQEGGNVLFFKAGQVADRTFGKRLRYEQLAFLCFLSPESYLFSEEIQASYNPHTRTDPSRFGPADPSELPPLAPCSSPYVLQKV
jgi:hypothetical protein